MKLRVFFLAISLFSLLAAAAMAGGPIASPYEAPQPLTVESNTAVGTKAFGDPTDFKASAIASADYIRYMQADVTDDNAGNDLVDTDPDDAGWDWSTTAFSHSASASSLNLYGVTANGMLQTYQFAPDPALFIAMRDAADHMVVAGPASIRSAADLVFLLQFATLPEVTNPSYYTDGARAMWEIRLTTHTTATAFAEGLREYRGASGSWANGIIPWDLAPYCEALMALDVIYPGNDYADDAAEIVEVLYADSYLGLPGYFEPHGHSKGYDPTYTNRDYYLYPGGVTGLIRAFETTGMYAVEIPALEALLLECQYDDGAFCYQYGAPTDINDRDWQTSAYAIWCLKDNLAPTATNLEAIYKGGAWLAETQDVSGGWVYDDGSHYPEIGGECAAAMAYAWLAAGSAVTTSVDGADPALCSATKTANFSFDRNDGTPGLFGYEIILDISGPITFDTGDFHDEYGMDFFYVVDMGAGQYSVNGTLYGDVPGILTDADLFTLVMLTNSDGPVVIDIASYNLRDPDNAQFFADMSGAAFVVDCTAPAAVTDIAAAPHHKRIEVDWNHTGVDVDHYLMFSGLWHNGAGASVYPEYDDVVGNAVPVRPADYAAMLAAVIAGEWVGLPAVTTTNGNQVWTATPDRGVYYYEVFAVDAAGNVSPAAASNDRATNYWLGDIDEDGFVNVMGDITPLGTAFGTAEGHGDYDPLCDVGRTDDWSRVGIPLTDSVINFEDLMVFSMNFSVVSDVNKTTPVISQAASLEWVRYDEGRYALRLVDADGLKGLRVQANLPAGTITSVTAGALLDQQNEMTFLKNVGDGLDVNLAVMGVNTGIKGDGDLFVVQSQTAIDPADLSIELRAVDNRRQELKLDQSGDTETPRAFALNANYPNPFNPMTKISFSLPEKQAVTLTVYAVDGRKVATLLNEVREAGLHEVLWMGRDDSARSVASGTYFYRIDAGPYSQVKKMTLMK
jgi:hypothetical protein